MTLAARLDRLRAAAGAGPGAATPTLPRGQPQCRPEHDTQLAHALDGQALAPGLLVVERVVPLPGNALQPGDLARLPEAAGRVEPDWLYLDIETTGLSVGVGNLAFVVGAGRLRDDRHLQVRQYLLTAFAGERPMLARLADWLGPAATLVSYNGKGFDVPVLQARACLHGDAFDWSGLDHVDLLYTVRRAYRRYWPDCRLQTVERRLLAVRRVDDLPGAEAPAAWHDWLRCGHVEGLRGVMRHNLQDLVSLARVHRALLPVYAGEARAGDRQPVDYRSIGRAWHDAGCPGLAEQVWCSAGDRLDDDGRLALAAHYRRRGQWRRAEEVWLALHARGDARAACELSKYYEHRLRDYQRALRFTEDCDLADRHARADRLKRKLGLNLPLPLTGRGPTAQNTT